MNFKRIVATCVSSCMFVLNTGHVQGIIDEDAIDENTILECKDCNTRLDTSTWFMFNQPEDHKLHFMCRDCIKGVLIAAVEGGGDKENSVGNITILCGSDMKDEYKKPLQVFEGITIKNIKKKLPKPVTMNHDSSPNQTNSKPQNIVSNTQIKNSGQNCSKSAGCSPWIIAGIVASFLAVAAGIYFVVSPSDNEENPNEEENSTPDFNLPSLE